MNINVKPPIYDPAAVQPMRDELTYAGFQEASVPQNVEDVLSRKDDKTTLVMINSVCGCAAGSARPGITLALQNKTIPDRLITVFAGQDRDSVDYLREKYLSAEAPSSPALALIKNGEVIFNMPRFHIEGRTAEEVAASLVAVFNKYCKAAGPSISPEAYSKLVEAKVCGSKIPLNNNG